MDTLQQINDIASSLLQSLPHRRPETLVLGSTARGALATSVDQTNVSFQYPPTPADSRGSASEEELPAARAKKSLQAARARSKKT